MCLIWVEELCVHIFVSPPSGRKGGSQRWLLFSTPDVKELKFGNSHSDFWMHNMSKRNPWTASIEPVEWSNRSLTSLIFTEAFKICIYLQKHKSDHFCGQFLVSSTCVVQGRSLQLLFNVQGLHPQSWFWRTTSLLNYIYLICHSSCHFKFNFFNNSQAPIHFKQYTLSWRS